MKKYNSLLMKAAIEYGIVKGNSEDIGKWKVRVIYSIMGRMALASLFDTGEETSSIVHMKRRIEMLLKIYKEMYPEIRNLMPDDGKEMSSEIYDIYLHSGVIYHAPHRTVMALKSEATLGNIKFTRGSEIESVHKLSGLGTYLKAESGKEDHSLYDMFQIDNNNMLEVWQFYLKKAKWKNFDVEANVEYLRMKPPFKYGYWIDKPYNNGVISILRTGLKGNYLYYLYKIENGDIKVSQLPKWVMEEYNYRSIANACLYKEGVLPPSIFKVDGELVHINFGYLPPPSELYLWKLYTWPESMLNLPSDFRRVCMRSVFNAIKNVMVHKGYEFIEEK